MRRTRRRFTVGLLVAALVLPFAVHPASAVSGGHEMSDDEERAHYLKGGFGTVRVNINNGERSCSGVGINEDELLLPESHTNSWVLTAQSCFADDPAKDYHVPAGPPKKPATVSFFSTANGTWNWTTSVKRLVPRPDRDLVLVQVAVYWGSSAHIAQGPPRVGETLTSAGFGRSATDWAPEKGQLGNVTVNSTTATAVNVGGTASACKGDAGGPLYREVGDRFEIVGVHGTSWEHGCFGTNESRNGSTEARVDDIYEWIRQQIPNFNYDCSAGLGYEGYGSLSFYSAKNNALYETSSNDLTAREGVADPLTWYSSRAPVSGSGWGGELRAGPVLPAPPLGLGEWDHPIWEVHRKANAQDPFNDGDLRLWNDPFTKNTHAPTTPLEGGERVATGWQRYLDPAFRNQFTIDSAGRIYAIDSAGALREYNWQAATKTWRNPAGDVIDTGWGKYDSITASVDGVLYARTTDGNLYRFQYDHATNTWTQRDKPAGAGWNAYTSITSPGGDILYGAGTVQNGVPVLRWHRYYTEFDTWAARDADGLGRVVLSDAGLLDGGRRPQATPNMCGLHR
ncbi:tachylectin-related carbohydrate-binding protein [Kibdelosporangium lantanae]|uniref:Tachylectin-related carbohydrate-binding protein n=1 Tax=Kibdelosporangium lantanae TaxID=1497396 RepID=A0ABW3M4J9_9PSEU